MKELIAQNCASQNFNTSSLLLYKLFYIRHKEVFIVTEILKYY